MEHIYLKQLVKKARRPSQRRGPEVRVNADLGGTLKLTFYRLYVSQRTVAMAYKLDLEAPICSLHFYEPTELFFEAAYIENKNSF